MDDDILGPPPKPAIPNEASEANLYQTPFTMDPTDIDVLGPPPKGYLPPEQTMHPGMESWFAPGTPGGLGLSIMGFRPPDKKINNLLTQGFKEGFGDEPLESPAVKEFVKSLTGPDQPNEVQEAGGLVEGLARAAALGMRGAAGIYHAVGDVAVHWGIPPDIVGMPDAFAGSPHMLTRAHGDLPMPIPKVGEEAANRAAAVEALTPKRPSGEGVTIEQVQINGGEPFQPDPAQTARTINPTLFNEYDTLTQQKAVLEAEKLPFRQRLEAGGRTLGEAPIAPEDQVTPFRAALEGEGRPLGAGFAEPTTPPLTLEEINDRLATLQPLIDKSIERVQKEVDLTIDKEKTQYGNTAIVPTEDGYTVGGVKVRSYSDAVEQAKAAEGDQTPVEPVKPPLNTDLAEQLSQQIQKLGRSVEESNAVAEVQAAHARAMAGLIGVTPEEYMASHAAKFVRRAPPGQGAAAPKGAQGATLIDQEGRSWIRIFKSGNASTGFHELAHSWLNEIFSLEKDPRATDGLQQLAGDARRELGMTDDQTEPTTAQHETFARGAEQYFRDGVAPTTGLQRVFAKIAEWFKSIYETTDALGEPISAGMRSIYDRLIGGDQLREVAGNFADMHEADLAAATPATALRLADRIRTERDLVAAILPEEMNRARLNSYISKPAGSERPSPFTGRSEAAVRPTPTRGNVPARAESAGQFAQEPSPEPAEVSAGGTPVKADGDGNLGPTESKFVKADGTPRPENIESPADIDQIISEGARDLAQTPTTGRSILNLAYSLGITPANITGGAKVLFNNAHVEAAIRLINESSSQVKAAMARAASSGLETDYLAAAQAMFRHEMISDRINQVGTDWAHIGHQYNQLRNVMGISKGDISSFLRETTGRDLAQTQQAARLGSLLPSAGSLSAFLRQSKGGRAPLEVYYLNALLSGPFTHMWYVVGNALEVGLAEPGRVALGGVAAAVRARTPLATPGDRMVAAEARATFFGMSTGFRKGLTGAYDAFQTGMSGYLPGERVYNSANLGLTLPQTTGVPTIFNYPYKSVAAIHTFFKMIAYEQEIARLAVRQAEGVEGLTGVARNQRVADLMARPTQEMEFAGTENALKRLYMRQGPNGPVMKAFNNFREIPIVGPVLFPFIHYGMEITRNAFIEGTPLGLASKEVRNNILMRNGGAAFDYQAGKMMFGTGLLGIGALSAAMGLITGNGPTDPAQRPVWLQTHRPNSLNIGPISIPINKLGPVSLLLLTPANLMETYSAWYGNPSVKQDLDTFALATGKMIMNVELEETMIRQVKDLTEAAFEGGFKHALFNMAPNWLPYSSLLGQVTRKIDPHVKYVSNLQDAFLAKLPGLSRFVPDQVDLFGNPVHPADLLQGAAPYANDPVAQELNKLNMGINKVDKKIMGVELTPRQYIDYATKAGQLAHQVLTGVMASPTWKPMTPGEKVKAIHTVMTSVRSEVAKTIAGDSQGTDNDIIKQATENLARTFQSD